MFAASAAFMICAACRQEQSLPLDPASRFTPSGEQRSRDLGIYSGKTRVGDLRFSLRNGTWDSAVPATELSQSIFLRLSFQGQVFTLRSDQRAWAGNRLDFLGSEGWMDFGAGRWETWAQTAGKGRLETAQKTSGGSYTREAFEVPDGMPVSDILPLFLNSRPPGDGSRRQTSVFNPTLEQEIPFTWADGGDTPLGRLFTVSYWGMEEKLWLDSEGMVVQEEMLLGVHAREPGQGEPSGDLPLESVLSAVAVPGEGIPDSLGDLPKATLVLEGSFRPPPESRWQKVTSEGGRALVTIERAAAVSGDKGRESAATASDDFALCLDSPRIAEISGRITGGIEDPWEKGLAVCRWVNRSLKKSMKESFSALQVLDAGEGECQSHALLAVSLCRSSGVPARFAYGVVYMPDRGAFLFHTWVEIFAGEWIPMDPTLGDFPSGVDHLTLAVGGYRDQFRIFPYIMGTGGWRITWAGSP